MIIRDKRAQKVDAIQLYIISERTGNDLRIHTGCAQRCP